MKFLEIVKKLQLKNHGYIVIVKNGIFFTGAGKDAILLNKILGLKLICLKTGMCKAGFLVKTIEKYIRLLSLSGKSFVVYHYDRKTGIEEEVYRYNGDKIYEDRCCLNCKDCEQRKETDEEILERVKQNISVVEILLELKDKQIIKVKAYNEKADWI